MILTPPGTRLDEKYLTHLKSVVNTDVNPIKYLAIDPGKANGICGYDEKYYLQFMLTIQADDMSMFLHQFDKIDTCVVEDYVLYPNKAKQQVYSDMETPRVIGRIEMWAELKKVKIAKQKALVKATGYRWLGKKPLPKSNKQNHEMDAHVHFIFWAVYHNRISADTLLTKPKNDNV